MLPIYHIWQFCCFTALSVTREAYTFAIGGGIRRGGSRGKGAFVWTEGWRRHVFAGSWDSEVWSGGCAVPRAGALEDTACRDGGIGISFGV